MKKKKAKEKLEVQLHQHQDKKGRVFGHPHPVAAVHRKIITQKKHDLMTG